MAGMLAFLALLGCGLAYMLAPALGTVCLVVYVLSAILWWDSML
jgi:hypothetical protein